MVSNCEVVVSLDFYIHVGWSGYEVTFKDRNRGDLDEAELSCGHKLRKGCK